MAIVRIDVYGVRNLQAVRLLPSPKINILYGENGSGKTSLLESVYLLASARSFRNNNIRTVITIGAEECTVHAVVRDHHQIQIPLGLTRSKQGLVKTRIAGNSAKSASELACHLPVQLINADTFLVLDGAPSFRRQFLDWGVFHIDSHFHGVWRRHQKALKQRNSLLRRDTIDPRLLSIWTEELVAAAADLDQLRHDYFDELVPVFETCYRQLSELDEVVVDYQRGWDKKLSYGDALEHNLASDQERGFTQTGPQRADIRFRYRGLLAKDVMSRGQQKILILALRIAQAQLLSQKTQKQCTFLIDDLPAELDEGHRQKVLQLFQDLDCQLFVTAVFKEEIVSLLHSNAADVALFQVKEGTINRCEFVANEVDSQQASNDEAPVAMD